MSLTLPTSAPSELMLSDYYRIAIHPITDPFDETETVVCVECRLEIFDAAWARSLLGGIGATPADAFLAIFGDEDTEGLVIPADVALALDELGHQAVRIVCQRLSGGEMDSAVFAEAGKAFADNATAILEREA